MIRQLFFFEVQRQNLAQLTTGSTGKAKTIYHFIIFMTCFSSKFIWCTFERLGPGVGWGLKISLPLEFFVKFYPPAPPRSILTFLGPKSDIFGISWYFPNMQIILNVTPYPRYFDRAIFQFIKG